MHTIHFHKGRDLFAELLAQRFQVALKRYRLQKLPQEVDASELQPPCLLTAQGRLL